MCPTCGHTIQRVNEGINPITFWCPRCGTLKVDKGVPDSEAPYFMKTVVRSLVNVDDSIRRDEPGPVTGVLWAKVMHVFGLGSTSACALCRALGFDPEEKRSF